MLSRAPLGKARIADMYRFIRPFLFLVDPERIHGWVTRFFKAYLSIGFIRRWFMGRHSVDSPKLKQTIWGVEFPNPIGLAAGFDKNAELYVEMAALGFGFVEIGTVTAQAQAGNPKPRMFRLKADHALINRMGFNNEGADAAGQRLAKREAPRPLGVNIGRTKVVPNERAIEDYCVSLERLWTYADYLVVNVSSPNTPDLRDLQGGSTLNALLGALRKRLDELAEKAEREPPPLLVKIAPDLDDAEVVEICDVVRAQRMDGIIATNTTITRDGLTTSHERVQSIGNGGLSGRPLTDRSVKMVKLLRENLGPDIPIVGAGGVFDASDAWALITAGASLVQVYTGFIYEGPKMVRDINYGLLDFIEEYDLGGVSEAVGLAEGGG